ncbi:MAG: AbrB/MazE/SpoVT family DNA-binding domain-containing protein [Clostridia bacterium]|nr:AbrB/MazE/SpoVT family DNA-binding domain-containing protein [Clostridia bacterium]
MKATGIVRRIDDLGRVVIPKEIRRTMHIREGAPLEIFTDTQGGVIFKKYSPVGELSDVTEHYADVLYRSVNTPILICDRDHVISCAGVSKRDFMERHISEELENVMEERKLYTGDVDNMLYPIDGIAYAASIVAPIISNGDILGAVVFLFSDGTQISPTETKLAQVAASFLGRQMEE